MIVIAVIDNAITRIIRMQMLTIRWLWLIMLIAAVISITYGIEMWILIQMIAIATIQSQRQHWIGNRWTIGNIDGIKMAMININIDMM